MRDQKQQNKEGKKLCFKILKEVVSVKDLAVYTRQFAILLNSGIGMTAIFKIMLRQTKNLKLKQATENMKASVVLRGLTLSAAMAEHKDVFSSLYIIMIKCGEKSGSLPKTLTLLAENLEKEVKLRGQYIAALTYPVITILSSLLTVIFVIKYVFPALMPLFTSFGVELPWPTRALIFFNVLLGSWLFWVIFLVVFVFMTIFIKKIFKTYRGRKFKDAILMNTPFVDRLIVKMILTRFCGAFAVLYSAGYPLLPSLDLLSTMLDNTVYEKEVKKIVEKVRHGQSVAEAIKQSFLFPRLVVNMISVGETTGAMEKSLISINSYYELELKHYLDRFNTLLEPALIIVLGFLTGFILLAIMLPLYNIFGSFSKI